MRRDCAAGSRGCQRSQWGRKCRRRHRPPQSDGRARVASPGRAGRGRRVPVGGSTSIAMISAVEGAPPAVGRPQAQAAGDPLAFAVDDGSRQKLRAESPPRVAAPVSRVRRGPTAPEGTKTGGSGDTGPPRVGACC